MSLLFKSGFLLILILAAPSCSKSQIKNSGQKMSIDFYRTDLSSPISIEPKIYKIKASGETVEIPDALIEEYDGGYHYRFLNLQNNSRLKSSFSKTALWKIKWKTEIDSSLIPWYVLTNNDRIVIQNENGWELFDESGKKISSGPRSDGNIGIDKINNIFYENTFNGLLHARQLSTGKNQFQIYPYFGKGYERTVLSASEKNILVHGFELPVMTHDSPIRPAEYSILETIDLGSLKEIDEDGMLSSAFQKQVLVCRSSKPLIATVGEKVVFAVPDHIFFMDEKLEVSTDLQENFIPVSLSLDELMNIYVVVKILKENNEEKIALWVISKEGNLISNTELKDLKETVIVPPVIGFDHTVYIILNQRIIAVNSSGKIIWDKMMAGVVGGAAITPDNRLLVAEGNLLTSIDKAGERNFIYDFENESLLTQPLVNEKGEIIIASNNFLYCIEPKK